MHSSGSCAINMFNASMHMLFLQNLMVLSASASRGTGVLVERSDSGGECTALFLHRRPCRRQPSVASSSCYARLLFHNLPVPSTCVEALYMRKLRCDRSLLCVRVVINGNDEAPATQQVDPVHPCSVVCVERWFRRRFPLFSFRN